MTTRFWFQNTTTEPGTGDLDGVLVRDLSDIQGAAGTLSNSAGNTTTDTEVMRFQRPAHVNGDENIAGSIRCTVLTADTVFSLEVRRYASDGSTLLASGARSAEFDSTGVQTFSLDASGLGWQEGDVLAISVYHRRVAGKGGNDFTVATGDADSFVDVNVVADTSPSEGSASGSWQFAGAADGETVRSGTAVGSFAWSGAASGEAPGVAASEGSAAGTFSWSGAAAGVTPPDVEPWTWDGAAFTWAADQFNRATGSYSWSGRRLVRQPVRATLPAPTGGPVLLPGLPTVPVRRPAPTVSWARRLGRPQCRAPRRAATDGLV